MKKQVTILALSCLSYSAFAQTTSPVSPQAVNPPQKAMQAEPPKPITPGGELKQVLNTPAPRHDKIYEAPLVQPNVPDPVVRPAAATSPNTAVQQKPKLAPQVKEN